MKFTAVSDYFSHRLLSLSFVTTCVQREDDKRFHVRQKPIQYRFQIHSVGHLCRLPYT